MPRGLRDNGAGGGTRCRRLWHRLWCRGRPRQPYLPCARFGCGVTNPALDVFVKVYVTLPAAGTPAVLAITVKLPGFCPALIVGAVGPVAVDRAHGHTVAGAEGAACGAGGKVAPVMPRPRRG